jgi:hypothetical protein
MHDYLFLLRAEFSGDAKQGGKIQLGKIWNAAAFGLKCS